ncbi:unnamed protein product [Polarella glacialis]|nr:unnamed protein product [Polarella glacialis]CAE8609581.1 unnamed protein product [Polarella glacialis]CAE8614163.1 unnamed protein product [Polarella glacialis]
MKSVAIGGAESEKYTRIMQQMQDSKKYEVDADDQSAAVCNHPEAISKISCASSTKCCTSKRSFLAGTAHDKQTAAKLYSICCPMESHCKYDTIFVSCAPGAGADDTSGVLAGLVQEATEQENEAAQSAKYTRIMHQMQDNKKYEVDADDQSAAVCNHPEAISKISCASSTKCCTSKRSFLAGTAHDKQTAAKLYSICCPMESHCKYDTIFVSCAPGAGADDTSGVLAGLVQEATEQENEAAQSAKYTRIMQQMQDNKKYEVDVDDQSAAVCNHPEAISKISCASSTKCCTSKRSFLAGTAHDKQTAAKLYSICCPMESHCKYDTIFVSCAPGAGADDTSGVLAGLVQEATEQENEAAQSAKYTRIMHQMQDNKKYEVDVDDQSAAVCNHPEAISKISCASSTKCCTSKRSFLAGTAHDKQTAAKLYSICCPMESHCKYDTIFVSCAPGAGADDTSGVLAGL